MAPLFSYDDNVLGHTTAIAIDKDKNSPFAVRWAIDHLVITNPFIILIHVEHKNQDENESDYDINQLFFPFRGYCARKGIQLKEVIQEDVEVCRALVEYVSRNSINNLVIDATTRNSLSRKSKHDVPANIIKSSPEFCSVYLISKGKVLTMRAAQRPVSNTATPPKVLSGLPLHIPSNQLDEDGIRQSREMEEQIEYRWIVPRNYLCVTVTDKEARLQICHLTSMQQCGYEGYFIIRRSLTEAQLVEYKVLNLEVVGSSPTEAFHNSEVSYGSCSQPGVEIFSVVSATPTGQVPQSTRDMEAETRRLKLELKQTMDLYSTASKEALTAKRKADEHQWKMEEAREFEEARLAGEAALAMAEKEKAKCKPAMEAAKASRRLAEIEAHRRRQAKLKAKKEADEKTRALNVLAKTDVRYRKYTIEEIEEATENFAASNKIGEGGYGPIFKGKLDHTPVPIKVLRSAQEKETVPARDRNYMSKIADVGLARLVPPSVADSVTQYYMTSAAGTFCHIDPEYQQTGMLTTKSDIYSFGIMLLQIITANPPMGIAHHVAKAIEKGILADVLDPAVRNWPLEEALSFAQLSLKCVELRKNDRPDLGTVIVPELNRLRDFGMRSNHHDRSDSRSPLSRSRRIPSEDQESSSMTSSSE
ncbi:Cyclophilin-like peptidyl-prolyl cis-trans isomerase family protein isoform 1 [Hibiscus syriacus]|uniref:RING-type E3 ubiquitin transferase n=1 Tax=Hibiscus syriacus TaxID=106335 RepID=A0A6A3A7P0_HIBSY|nr:Cyclophilin-like peptidyl-prolyl cis-trans isomerase family protein isoform 1 [Hibiscus syriacus]